LAETVDGGEPNTQRVRDFFIAQTFDRMEEHVGTGDFPGGGFAMFEQPTEIFLFGGR
jgi:hypothetical protein